MRTALVILVAAGLGFLFLVQKRHEPKSETAPITAPTRATTPRPVSEHNWAKHALDTTTKVTQQVAQQQKDDPTR